MSMGLVRPRPGRFVLDICSAQTGNLHIHSSNNTWRQERQILKPKKLNNLKLWKLNPLTPTRFKDLCPIKGTQEWWLHPILAYTPKTVRLAVHLSNIFIPYIVPITPNGVDESLKKKLTPRTVKEPVAGFRLNAR